MVMHRALFTWFLLLVFFILLCLRLEIRTHWNWFLVFLPMWLFDVLLLIDAIFYLVMHCRREHMHGFFKNKHLYFLLVVLLKIAAQIILCLKLEYKALNLQVYHVVLPFSALLSILTVDVSITLFKNEVPY